MTPKPSDDTAPIGLLGPVLGVARFELRRLRRALIALLGLLVLIGALALYSGALHLRHQDKNAELIQAQHQDYLSKQTKRVSKRVKELQAAGQALTPDRKSYRNPAYLAQHGAPALVPNGPLSLVSAGVAPLQPQSTQVTLADPALLEARENLQHPLQLWTGHFDLSFVLVYLLPLLLIAFSFDLTAGEQASGNLKMLLVQGGGLRALVWGKLLARTGILAAMLLLLSLLSWATAQSLNLPFGWGRWSLMMLATMLYGLVWIGLAAVLNALRRKPATIAASLAALWLLAVWVLPGSSQQLLQSLVPVPSRLNFVQSVREASEQVRQESSRLLGKYLEDHPELAGGTDNKYAMLQLSKEQAMAKSIRPVVDGYQAQLTRQRQIAAWLQYLSPVTVFEASLMQLAGSGPERYQAYRQQLEAFHGQWQSFFLPLLQQNQALLPSHFTTLPQFQFREPGRAELAPVLLPQLLFLALLAAGLLGYSLKRYQRYQVIEADS